MTKLEITFEVNGRRYQILTEPHRRLLDILRDDLDLISVKEGCGKGECGSCTVFLDGYRVNACLIPALQLHNRRLYTVEGVKTWPAFEKVEKFFVAHGAVQCGFCMPGMIMSAMAFIGENYGGYNKDQIKAALAGNMCRCTGYTKIIDCLLDLQDQPDIVTELKETWPK